MGKEKFHKIAIEVQEEWKMGGLADTIYEDYAFEIAKRYFKADSDIPKRLPCGCPVDGGCVCVRL